MKQLVTTETGSQYLIDHAAKTWVRLQKTTESGELRDESGTFILCDEPVVGKRVGMVMEARDESLRELGKMLGATAGRLVYTSQVVAVEELREQ